MDTAGIKNNLCCASKGVLLVGEAKVWQRTFSMKCLTDVDEV